MQVTGSCPLDLDQLVERISQETAEKVVAILRKQPTGEYEREAPLPSVPRGVRYSEDPDGLYPDSGQGDAGNGVYAGGGELA